MIAEGDWVASRYVHFALAVEVLEVFACLLLVAMPSIATFPTGHLVSVLSLPRPVIALDAISELSLSLSLFFFFFNLSIIYII